MKKNSSNRKKQAQLSCSNLPGLKPESEVTKAEKERLIDLIKITPELWDTSLEEYKKLNLIDDC